MDDNDYERKINSKIIKATKNFNAQIFFILILDLYIFHILLEQHDKGKNYGTHTGYCYISSLFYICNTIFYMLSN